MAIKTSFMTIGAAILVAIGVASCDSGKQVPTQPSTTTPPPTQSPTLVRVDLSAPASIAPGESVQLTANAVRSDGSVSDVAAQAQWSSSDPRVLEISPAGAAKANARGEAVITVRYQSRTASTRTFVLPSGTYRLSGTVADSGFGVAGATVAVIDGIGEGLTTITNASGGYALYGVRDHVRLHAKREGYLNQIAEIDVGSHRTFDLEMAPERERADLRGSYTLTVSGAGCSSAIPQTRSYDATVIQNGPRLTVALAGADFIVTRGRGNAFSGIIDGSGRITFSIGDVFPYYYDYYYGQYDLVERLDTTNALIISGRATAGPSSRGISGSLEGELLLARGTAAPFTRFDARCYSTAHRFELVRR